MNTINRSVKVLAVVGTRTYNNRKRLFMEIDELRKYYVGIERIVTGDATGADSLAVDYAKQNKLKFTIHKAQWDDMAEPCAVKVNTRGKEYNALAGFKRNTTIVEECDMLMAFTNGSPGTADSIRKAEDVGKKVKVIHF